MSDLLVAALAGLFGGIAYQWYTNRTTSTKAVVAETSDTDPRED